MSLETRFTIQRGDFSLTVDQTFSESGVTAIFGPSGSGKTTFLRAIAGLDHIPGAQIRFQNQVWQDAEHFLLPHQRPIGYVFQEPSLFPHLNVRDNLEYGLNRTLASERRISLDDAVNLLDIGALLTRLPYTLSGGEQQRVAIARTLAVSPQLLLMDEPLSSLDNKLKQEILPYLESLHRELEIPVIYVSHATDEVARLADHLVILRKGEILGSGTVQDMLTRLDLPLSHRNDAESLINASVKEVDEEYGLSRLESSGTVFTVSGTSLEPGTTVRLRIAAHDVSLTLEKQTGTSIQNIFPVTVQEIEAENESQCLIKVSLAGNPILSRITKKSIQVLGIEPGKEMFAQIKTVAVLS
ncbi:MAG: molybdenum ABC transporter ATP-binding protein [Gammaproteobacteria bacterium]|nr:molybdenum ABC transporter ATP-binding protein [Gammaproteobacteria bacterium]